MILVADTKPGGLCKRSPVEEPRRGGIIHLIFHNRWQESRLSRASRQPQPLPVRSSELGTRLGPRFDRRMERRSVEFQASPKCLGGTARGEEGRGLEARFMQLEASCAPKPRKRLGWTTIRCSIAIHTCFPQPRQENNQLVPGEMTTQKVGERRENTPQCVLTQSTTQQLPSRISLLEVSADLLLISPQPPPPSHAQITKLP